MGKRKYSIIFEANYIVPIAGINPAQGHQIPPQPKGIGSPLVKMDDNQHEECPIQCLTCGDTNGAEPCPDCGSGDGR